ncbi:uncharacterized protein LOC108630049 [Ceratina calcarata]|uniref:Uncharacterized protein LOC108630049 n=1 Tax=Ceratina calcarata TaxID=156304 RepID=A0AAJ7NCJ1_9HYME|nr:uncharacterized protein LOC108630049 [Ceratina calcarata]
MFETGRRSAISTSQLGLYSDHVDRYNRNRYGSIARKFAIGIMVVMAVILIGIFLYDFTSATSANKMSQETKHMYILQNAMKKPTNFTRRLSNSTIMSPTVNRSSSIQDRSDDGNSFDDDRVDAEFRSQNLENFKLRKRVLKSVENNEDPPEGKQLFDNHAVVYRVRQRYKYPESNEEEGSEESRPVPFHWELKTPQPTAFKRPRYPQLTQYRYPHASRNIQDIIKYLTNDADLPNRGIKFSGVYVNPKKFDMYPEAAEIMANNDRSEEEEGSYVSNEDPFYQFKPKHPADVNLLAMSNFRFSPTGLTRYNYDSWRPNYYKPSSMDPQYENIQNNYPKKRKPQPFSVMLDIYPITDIEQNKKTTRPKPVPIEDYEMRRPIQFNRGNKVYAMPQQPLAGMSNQPMSEEEERQQMIFHLNLYPRKKNKLSRKDIIHRSQSLGPEERQQFVEKVWSPLETIAKHLAVERSKFMENEEENLAATRYEESTLGSSDEGKTSGQAESIKANQEPINVPLNHKSSIEDDYASTENYEYQAQKFIQTTTDDKCDDTTTTTTTLNEATVVKNENADSKDIDTVEGFKEFSDSVSKN